MDNGVSQNKIKEFLSEHGIVDDFALELLKGGRNNRVYKVVSGLQKLLLKEYFRHSDDPRDRCSTEFEFSTFTWNQGIRSIPEPLQCNAEAGLALYEYEEGRKLSPSDISESLIQQAVDFVLNLNKSGAKGSAFLRDASESCFSITEHVKCVVARVEKLSSAVKDSNNDTVKQFVEQHLTPTWESVQERIAETCTAAGLAADHRLKQYERILSPSDFGFHNAILTPQGSLAFFDFEYAGWDDPAKTICDFFLQPAVPVPLNYRPFFLDQLLQHRADHKLVKKRADVLFPIYQIKWCCILLNEFLPADNSRREFALGAAKQERGNMHQLVLAANALDKVNQMVKIL